MIKMDKNYLLIRCVYLYYSEKLNIKEIADRLNISRFRVSRYIKQAEEKGYVEIKFHFPGDNYDIIATKIEQRFSIKNIIIVPVIPDMDAEMIRKTVGEKGAEILESISKNSSVGVTWGRTIAKMVESLPYSAVKLERITELTGGYGMIDTPVSSSSLAPLLAKKTKSLCFQVHAPIIASNENIAKNILQEESIKRTLELAEHSNVAIFGAASISKDSMFYNAQILTEEELDNLRKKGAVGSVIGRFFNAKGVEMETSYKYRAISIVWDNFLKIPERIALIAGENKLESLIGVLTGKLATTLVIDSNLALNLIKNIDL